MKNYIPMSAARRIFFSDSKCKTTACVVVPVGTPNVCNSLMIFVPSLSFLNIGGDKQLSEFVSVGS